MSREFAKDIKMTMHEIFDGFGENTKKIADFYFTYQGSEIATGMRIRKAFSYQLHMGELERLSLNEKKQEIVHRISELANEHYDTGWDLSNYNKTSWKSNNDFFKIIIPTEKQNFIDRLKQMKNEKEEEINERRIL